MLNQRRRQHILGILVLVTWLSGCNEAQNGLSLKTAVEKQSSPLTVNAFQIKRETKFTKSSVYFGKLTPRRQSRLSFRQPGTVGTVLKQVGDSAAKGEKLAVLDQAQLEDQKQQLQQSILRLEQDAQNSARRQSPEQLNNFRGQLNRVEQQLANGVIVAPYDCIIAQSNVGVGDLVSQQIPAFEIVENAAAAVEVQLPFDIADNLTVGQTVFVTARETVLTAVVKSKSPTITAVGNKLLTLEITDSSGNDTTTMFGQTVKVKFQTEEVTQGFWIPQSALVGKSDGLFSALVVSNPENGSTANANETKAVVDQRLVKIISMKDDWVLVEATLPPEELVIVDGTHRIVPGQHVIPNDITASLDIPSGGDAQ